MFVQKKIIASMLLLGAAGGLAGCGDGGGNASTGNETGSFSLALTDGPVDNATRVIVEFTGVSIKPSNGEALVFTFTEPKSIDLLQLQGSASEGLLTNEAIKTGSYEWIRLHVNASNDNVMDSYMEMNDGSQVELWIPSGGEVGLRLVSGFTIAAGGGVDFTIDFDLRKSITNPPGMPNAILKPALRLVDNMTVGSIAGTVDSTLVSQHCADATLDDGSVYVYTGADVTPVDIQGMAADPITTALVNVVDGVYAYEVGFLPEGDYTVAYTCTAANDDPAVADTLVFVGAVTVPVVADLATAHDFSVSAEGDAVAE